MRIVNLASGSKGNSTFVHYKDTKILIDAGISVGKLKTRLKEIGEGLENIDAVFITHEHTDHIAAVTELIKKFNIKVYMHEALLEKNVFSAAFRANIFTFNCTQPTIFQDICVQAFETSHDSVRPVGFVLNACGSRSKVGFVTDLGLVTDDVIFALSGAKIVFIESNYDESMLEFGPYPWPLKNRIRGKYGHLSNTQSVELADRLYKSGTKCFVLSHLSEVNNTPERAYDNFKEHFENLGYVLDKDLFIRVSSQGKHGNNFCLKEEF